MPEHTLPVFWLAGGRVALLESGPPMAGMAAAPLAVLSWAGLQLEADLLDSAPVAATLRLQQLSLVRGLHECAPSMADAGKAPLTPSCHNQDVVTLSTSDVQSACPFPFVTFVAGLAATARASWELLVLAPAWQLTELEAACAGPAVDEVLGLCPVRTAASPVRKGSSADARDASDGPLALWAQWQRLDAPDAPPAHEEQPVAVTGGSPTVAAPEHAVSVRVGQVFVAWVPGWLGRLLQAVSPQGGAGTPPTGQNAQASLPTVAARPHSKEAPTAAEPPVTISTAEPSTDWLSGAWAGDLSIAALQIAALAAEDDAAQAVVLAANKVSGRLGPVKMPGMAGAAAGEGARASATADLMRLPGGSPPHHGLRYISEMRSRRSGFRCSWLIGKFCVCTSWPGRICGQTVWNGFWLIGASI